jgi:DNA-directed RNA polymerase subunit RPC12/RpoP
MCSRCRKEFNFNNIKYDSDNSLICIDCLNKKTKLEKKHKKEEKPQEPEKINFICLECRYKFKLKKDQLNAAKCPFCGKRRLMLVKRYKDENDLINDSMDPRFDY